MKKAMILVAVFLTLCTMMAIADEGTLPVRDATTLRVGVAQPGGSDRDGSCTLALGPDDGTLAFFGWGATSAGDGERLKLWLDPETDQYAGSCTAPFYPFRVESFEVLFALFGDSAGVVGHTLCFNVDVECPNDFGDGIAGAAHGPGPVLYSQQICHTVTPEEWADTTGIISVVVTLTNHVCVNGPFFAGLEFVSWTGPADAPSPILNLDPLQAEENYDVWYYFNFAGLLPCWYTPVLDFGCGAGCNPGAWYYYVSGTAGADCDAAACDPCVSGLAGETDANPILIDSAPWSNVYDLCNYCSDYDQLIVWGPVLGSNTARGGDIVFELRFPPELTDVCFSLLIEPVCSANQHFRLRSWLSDSFGPFDRGTPPFPAVGGAQVYDFTPTGFGCVPNDVYRLYVDVRNCCCPVRITYNGDTPLPVELTSFDAIAGDNMVTLNWNTASERDLDFFQITRNEEQIANVPATNNPTGHAYSYVDHNVVNGTDYSYELSAYDINGAVTHFERTAYATPMAGIVAEYALNQNFPNPFNPSTAISYSVKEMGLVSLKVYSVDGREVATLVNDVQANGSYTVGFDGSDLASGVYLYTLKVNGFSATHKMVLMK